MASAKVDLPVDAAACSQESTDDSASTSAVQNKYKRRAVGPAEEGAAPVSRPVGAASSSATAVAPAAVAPAAPATADITLMVGKVPVEVRKFTVAIANAHRAAAPVAYTRAELTAFSVAHTVKKPVCLQSIALANGLVGFTGMNKGTLISFILGEGPAEVAEVFLPKAPSAALATLSNATQTALRTFLRDSIPTKVFASVIKRLELPPIAISSLKSGDIVPHLERAWNMLAADASAAAMEALGV